MSLVPVDKKTGRRRQTNEDERRKLQREKEKADYNKRNR